MQVYLQPTNEVLEGLFADPTKDQYSARNVTPRLIFRSLSIVVATLLAAMLPFFGDVNAVIGAFGFLPLDFAVPSVFYNLTFKPSKRGVVFWLNTAIAVISSVLALLSSISVRLDEVQRDFVKSKEEVRETSKGGSPFVLKIQDKPIPPSFRLLILEPYDRSIDPSEHIATFRTQMTLYNTFDTLMYRAFPTTLRGSVRMWYNRLKPSSISSFDHLAKEFKLNFMASSRPRPTAASLLGLAQGSDEPLAQFIGRFTAKVRRMPDAHPSLEIQTFIMALRPSQFFWSLIERPPLTVPKMLQQANQYVAVRTLVAGKREDHKRSQNDKPQGQPSGTSKRRDRPELPTPRPPPIPLNSTRTKIRGRDKRRYYHFHRDYGHDTKECNDLKNQIEYLICRGYLHRFVRDRQALTDEGSRRERESSPRPEWPIEKQIDVIIGGPASGGDSSSARKAYARSAVKKGLRSNQDFEITFGSGSEVYPDHDDALIISAQVTNV
ncbi:hypothetical protein B296_00024677 [Ensete ventricosum]|uniref:Retrotransposon gag domain-containing protein n=1 Tax=Ensete ventricosum TaxID=4639 RepID=A0A427ANJ8_ENSVE|nr:hypothetical protein B296_00024677 [Ensete ventricosum]